MTTGTIIIAEVVLVHLLHEVTSKSPHSGKTIVDVNKLRPMSRCAFSQSKTVRNCVKGNGLLPAKTRCSGISPCGAQRPPDVQHAVSSRVASETNIRHRYNVAGTTVDA